MKIVAIGTHESVTVELSPADCFQLAQACEQSIRYDACQNLGLIEALAAALTAAGMAAAATSHGNLDGYTLPEVVAAWMPASDRYRAAPPA